METIVPPAARTAATVASASSTNRPQPTTKAPSRAKVKAASRPMPPPVPVIMQTFPESRFDMVLLLDRRWWVRRLLLCCRNRWRMLANSRRNLRSEQFDRMHALRVRQRSNAHLKAKPLDSTECFINREDLVSDRSGIANEQCTFWPKKRFELT